MTAAVPLLSCRDVGKSFGALAAVNDLSFDVAAGEVLGIGGPNGAGKTTLFEVISGLNPASRGNVLLQGHDITRLTPASFEPVIDYVVVKIPRWNFEKFPQADRTLTTQMKSVGEAMAIGRTFKEAFMKGVASLELGRSGLLFAPSAADDEDDAGLRKRLAVPSDRRMWDLFRALNRGIGVEQIHELPDLRRHGGTSRPPS